ncbi:MAG TPA: chemotaxis protein CheC [Azospirillum sp.]|nr:chemotaxis protein CheC [Azospirillum sp.]
MLESFSELETDALTELVNVSVSKAAVTLSKMVQGGVSLTVPKVHVVPRASAAATLTTRVDDQLVAVGEEFQGSFSGAAVMVFPVSNSLELVRAVLPHMADLDEIIEMEQEALSEIGNILINSCLSTLANMLQQRITTSLPRVIYGAAIEILTYGGDTDSDQVMVFHVDFTMKERGIKGFILIVMSVSSLMALRQSVAAMIAPYAGRA